MFPFVMLVTSTIFCDPSWPVRVNSAIQIIKAKLISLAKNATTLSFDKSAVSTTPDLFASDYEPSFACLYSLTEIKKFSLRGKFACRDILYSSPERGHKLVVGALSIYVFIQCFLPWSHFITKGDIYIRKMRACDMICVCVVGYRPF